MEPNYRLCDRDENPIREIVSAFLPRIGESVGFEANIKYKDNDGNLLELSEGDYKVLSIIHHYTDEGEKAESDETFEERHTSPLVLIDVKGKKSLESKL